MSEEELLAQLAAPSPNGTETPPPSTDPDPTPAEQPTVAPVPTMDAPRPVEASRDLGPALTAEAEPPVTEGPTQDPEEAGAPPASDDSWRKAVSVEEVLKHESFSVPMKTREEEGYKRGRDATEKVEQYISSQNAQLGRANATSEAFTKGWNEIVQAVKDGIVPLEQIEQLQENHGPMIDALRGVHQEGGRWDGVNSVIANLALAVEDAELGTEFATRSHDVRTKVIEEDSSFFSDFADRLVGAKNKPLQDENTELKAKTQRLEEEITQLKRTVENGPPPPETPAGGSRGLSSFNINRASEDQLIDAEAARIAQSRTAVRR